MAAFAGRLLLTIVLGVSTLFLALCSYMLATEHGPDYPSAYLVSADGCTLHVAEHPGDPATFDIQGMKKGGGRLAGGGRSPEGCSSAPGYEVFYDPETMEEVYGPENDVTGAVVLGVAAAMMLFITIWHARATANAWRTARR